MSTPLLCLSKGTAVIVPGVVRAEPGRALAAPTSRGSATNPQQPIKEISQVRNRKGRLLQCGHTETGALESALGALT